MHRTIALATAGLIMTWTMGAAWAEPSASSTEYLESLMVENADTPAEHEALARYYRMKAADARSIAEEHRKMAERYRTMSHGKHGALAKAKMDEHCNRIAALNDDLAKQYEELAKGEAAAAKQ